MKPKSKPKPKPKLTFEWKCPKCEARPNRCGKGDCEYGIGRCTGFTCECLAESDDGGASADEKDHGMTLDAPCRFAICDHCGWGGTFPVPPPRLQAWEKKALEAGWSPPSVRAKELQRRKS